MTNLRFLLATALFLAAGQAWAQAPATKAAAEPYRAWLDYFEGTWTYDQIVGQSAGGEVTFRYAPGKFAVIGEGKRSSGERSAQLVAWQSDRKVLVDTDYSSDGNYSVIEYAEFGEREMKGRFTHFHTAAGNFTEATIVVTKESPDLVSALVKAKDPSGKPIEQKSTFKRKRS